jgi:hypothetical protein
LIYQLMFLLNHHSFFFPITKKQVSEKFIGFWNTIPHLLIFFSTQIDITWILFYLIQIITSCTDTLKSRSVFFSTFWTVVDLCGKNPAVAIPYLNFVPFFSAETLKKWRYTNPNRLRKAFLGHDRHPLTGSLDPPLETTWSIIMRLSYSDTPKLVRILYLQSF